MTVLGFHEQFASDMEGEFSALHSPAVPVVVTSTAGNTVDGNGVYERLEAQEESAVDGSQVLHSARAYLPKSTFASVEVGYTVFVDGITWRVEGLYAGNPACHVAVLAYRETREKAAAKNRL